MEFQSFPVNTQRLTQPEAEFRGMSHEHSSVCRKICKARGCETAKHKGSCEDSGVAALPAMHRSCLDEMC